MECMQVKIYMYFVCIKIAVVFLFLRAWKMYQKEAHIKIFLSFIKEDGKMNNQIRY